MGHDAWDEVLPPLTANKKFAKRQKYVAKKKAKAEARERPRAVQRRKAAKKAKTVVANAKTGKETLRKAKAKELVRKKKVAERQKRLAGRAQGGRAKQKAASHAPEHTAPSRQELERSLLAAAIRGDEDDQDGDAAQLVRNDPTLHPSLAFYDDYAERKSAEVASQEELLHRAHVYFKTLAKKDRLLHRAAARRLRELKAINRRGGDKDGFRYVVPRNVREMAQQMLAARGTAAVDPDTLVSHFGGDDVAHAVEDKPMRRRHRASGALRDFYQFQVSRQWTRNAENFLKRGRASKAMFEAKKHQRSIRKL